jgi:hypothetical protein
MIGEAALKRHTTSGFSAIYITEIEYQFVGSYGQAGQPVEVMKGLPPQKRSIVVKRDLPELMLQGKKSRVAH